MDGVATKVLWPWGWELEPGLSFYIQYSLQVYPPPPPPKLCIGLGLMYGFLNLKAPFSVLLRYSRYPVMDAEAFVEKPSFPGASRLCWTLQFRI